MNTILSRISQIADNENITITHLEKKIGASAGVLSRAIRNNTDIQSKWIQNIIENYPLYDANWLILGKGPMLKNQNDALSLTSEPQVQYGNQNDEIKYLKKIIENQQKELENKQKIIENQHKIIDKQINTIEAYEKGKIVNVSEGADVRAPKRGAG